MRAGYQVEPGREPRPALCLPTLSTTPFARPAHSSFFPRAPKWRPPPPPGPAFAAAASVLWPSSPDLVVVVTTVGGRSVCPYGAARADGSEYRGTTSLVISLRSGTAPDRCAVLGRFDVLGAIPFLPVERSAASQWRAQAYPAGSRCRVRACAPGRRAGGTASRLRVRCRGGCGLCQLVDPADVAAFGNCRRAQWQTGVAYPTAADRDATAGLDRS